MNIVTLARRPLASANVASNVLDRGTGALNIDASRLRHCNPDDLAASLAKNPGRSDVFTSDVYGAGRPQQSVNTSGRWPANLILEHRAGCRRVGERRVKTSAPASGPTLWGATTSMSRGRFNGVAATAYHGGEDGTELTPVWECEAGCPVDALDAQSGITQSSAGTQKYRRAETSGWVERGGSFTPGREWEAQGYGDVGGASRYFKQVGGTDMEAERQEVGHGIPQDFLDYLYTMITPTHVGGETLLALDIDAVDWSAIEDGRYHGVIARGSPTPEQTEHLWRVVKPGAHVLLIAPEDCPTGHRGACSLEDQGFEIRDAILWVREAGRLHYVPKANTRERNAGCDALAAKRKGPPIYELTEEALADEELVGDIQAALVEAGVAEDVAEAVVENGIPKDKMPAEFRKHFKKREGGGKYGNNHPCLHPDALVMTDNGYRPVSEVTENYRVLAADGTFHRVTQVSHHPYTSPNLYEIAVQGTNYKTLATDNHPFLIWRPTRSKKGSLSGGKVLWLQADEVRKGDYTMTPHLKDAGEGAAFPWTGRHCSSNDFWFVFGLYLAEGVLHRAGHWAGVYPSFTLHEDETHLVDRIREVCGKAGVYPKKGSKAVQVVAFDSVAGELCRYFGGHGAATKSLHPDVWRLSKEQQQAILEGYLAGDGGRVRDYWQAKTVSPDLASQLAVLAEGLGYKVNLFRFEGGETVILGRTVNALPHYQIQLYEKNRMEGRTRKPSRPTTIEHEGTTFTLRHVKAVTLVPYEGDVWNLSVEGSPTFQTAVGMSHNTVKSREIMVRLLADVPPDALVMDPFMGSGTTGLACLETGHDFIGIEREPEYIEICDARVRYWDRAKAGWVKTTIESEAPKVEDVKVDLDGAVFDMFGD